LSDKGLHARGKTVQVMIDLDTMKARRISEAEKAMLEEYVA